MGALWQVSGTVPTAWKKEIQISSNVWNKIIPPYPSNVSLEQMLEFKILHQLKADPGPQQVKCWTCQHCFLFLASAAPASSCSCAEKLF